MELEHQKATPGCIKKASQGTSARPLPSFPDMKAPVAGGDYPVGREATSTSGPVVGRRKRSAACKPYLSISSSCPEPIVLPVGIQISPRCYPASRRTRRVYREWRSPLARRLYLLWLEILLIPLRVRYLSTRMWHNRS